MKTAIGHVYRVQDRTGRGPFRPGFSHLWVDDERTSCPPSFIEEFGAEIISKMTPGYAYGCGVRQRAQVDNWFSPTEIIRLRMLGYAIVKLDVDVILAESAHQVVFGRRRPLRFGATEYR